ncbi:MAG: DUF2062 domain-containing protein [Candidatus Omnitrophota bacterium]
MKKNIIDKIKKFGKYIYTQLFLINDTPQKTAAGFGLGVFLGIIPGTGPLAALFCAMLLRVNKASAFLGSILVNTWINIVTFLLAIKIGSAIMAVDWRTVYASSAFKVIAPVLAIGYFVIAACAGIAAYLIVLLILKLVKNERSRVNKT